MLSAELPAVCGGSKVFLALVYEAMVWSGIQHKKQGGQEPLSE